MKITMIRNIVLPEFVIKIVKSGVQRAFSHHLFLTNVTISFSLSGAGDVIQQHYRIKCREQQSWDRLRTQNMTCSGVTVGVVCHHWYKILDNRLPGRTVKIVLKKLIADQLIGSPICILAFISTLSVLRGISNFFHHSEGNDTTTNIMTKTFNQEVSHFTEDLNVKGWKLYLADWVVWPPAQVINFYYLPTKYRVLYDNSISLMYDIYSSHVIHSSNKDDSVKDQANITLQDVR